MSITVRGTAATHPYNAEAETERSCHVYLTPHCVGATEGSLFFPTDMVLAHTGTTFSFPLIFSVKYNNNKNWFQLLCGYKALYMT